MKIIETTQDFNDFAENCKESDLIVIPIPSDHTHHPEQEFIFQR